MFDGVINNSRFTVAASLVAMGPVLFEGVLNSPVRAVGDNTSATGRREVSGVENISLLSGVLLGSESDREAREDPGGVDPYELRRSFVFSGLVL